MTAKKFNLFGSKNINLLDEKGHSTFLRRLLHPSGSHGQGALFLRNFLTDVLQTDFDENQTWVILQEAKAGKGRADLLIRTEDFSKVFVIENKIYWADDQQSQLYRYWRNRIYGRKEGKIVYLTFDGTKNPSEKSLEKPYDSGTKYTGLPEKLPDDAIIYISYKKGIYQWLDKCLKAIEKTEENRRLTDALEQYKEWIEIVLT
jgi:hypothetical protein